MTNRYRSSCCCDAQTPGICFNGFGTVPKTPFSPIPDACRVDSVSTDFNRYDNWSFCAHDKNEELLVYSERTKERFVSSSAFGDNIGCDCECCPNPDVTTYTLGEPPIYAWYRHMKNDGTQRLPVPPQFEEDADTGDAYLYFWRSVSRENLKPPSWLYPCCSDTHIFEESVAYGHDYYCREENYFWLCGYDENFDRWFWWKEGNGSFSYLTQTQMKLIGSPFDGQGWRTSDWGVVQGMKERCPDSDVGESGNPLNRQRYAGFCERGGEYLYLQDIVSQGPASGTGRLYRNFNLIIYVQGNEASVVPDIGFGDCFRWPYGLWPLSFTFWGVMHREKWWERYWNSMYRGDVCERNPDWDPNDETSDEFLNCPNPYENYDKAQELGIYPDRLASQCRFPRHVIQGCAGVPIFTHELVEKLDEDDNGKNYFRDLGDIGEYVKAPNNDGNIIQWKMNSFAAHVMFCISVGVGMHPRVTQYLEQVGILPPPVDYGEEQDYRIFKKSLSFYDPKGAGITGACCIPFDGLPAGSFPLYGDCGTPGEPFQCDQGISSCAEDPTNPECCCEDWQPPCTGPEGDPDDPFCCDRTEGERRVGCGAELLEDEGGLCDDTICQLNIVPNLFDGEWESEDAGIAIGWDTWTNTDFVQCIADNTSIDPLSPEGALALLNELRFCCGLNADGTDNPSGFWDDSCVTYAQYCGGTYCAPNFGCVETTEFGCRAVAGGQISVGESCAGGNAIDCEEHGEEWGSCCISVNANDVGIMHCMEVSREICDLFNVPFPGSVDMDEVRTKLQENLQYTVGTSEHQLDLLEEAIDLQGSVSGIKSNFGPNHNCEPLPYPSFDGTRDLDTFSPWCCQDLPCSPLDSPNTTNYPCDDGGPITFTRDDHYFYGRPGGWSWTCEQLPCKYEDGNCDCDGSPDEPDNCTINAEAWNAIFPNIPRGGGSVCNPNMPCWTATAFPQQQYSSEIPTCDCPQKDNNGECPDDPSNQGKTNGCGEPLLTTCGVLGAGVGYDENEPIDQAYPESNYAVFSPCLTNNASTTCFGAWFQSHHTNFENTPNACEPNEPPNSNCCYNDKQFYCANINNAFFLRVPEGRQTGGEDYTINLITSPCEFEFGESETTGCCNSGSGPGGSDDREWSHSPGLFVYINQILGGMIRLYQGNSHNIFQTDGNFHIPTLNETNGFELPYDDDLGDRIRLILLQETTDPAGSVGANGKYFVPYNGNDSTFIVTDSGTPGIDLILNCDLTQNVSIDDIPENLYWGLIYDKPYNENAEIIPIRIGNINHENQPNEGDNCPTYDNIPDPLFGYFRVPVLLEGQNPGSLVVDGLRDYRWYHAPVVVELARPSAYFTSDWACSGEQCCHNKLTEELRFKGETYRCPWMATNREQGQPYGENECNFDRLPSDGEGLPDPLCGPCPDGWYCCTYVDEPRCIPPGTFCCSGCVENEVCSRDYDGNISCIPIDDECQACIDSGGVCRGYGPGGDNFICEPLD